MNSWTSHFEIMKESARLLLWGVWGENVVNSGFTCCCSPPQLWWVGRVLCRSRAKRWLEEVCGWGECGLRPFRYPCTVHLCNSFVVSRCRSHRMLQCMEAVTRRAEEDLWRMLEFNEIAKRTTTVGIKVLSSSIVLLLTCSSCKSWRRFIHSVTRWLEFPFTERPTKHKKPLRTTKLL